MAVKVYKRTDSARSIDYQDGLLAPVVPGWPEVPTFFDSDITLFTRQTTRKTLDTIYVASLALFADTEEDLIAFFKRAKARSLKLICVEENIRVDNRTIAAIVARWKNARKHGAAMRGARKSAETKKANTAAALKLIEHELASTDTPSKVLLAKVGIRAIGSIKNHYGFPREELQRRYRAEQKRKARREAYNEQRA